MYYDQHNVQETNRMHSLDSSWCRMQYTLILIDYQRLFTSVSRSKTRQSQEYSHQRKVNVLLFRSICSIAIHAEVVPSSASMTLQASVPVHSSDQLLLGKALCESFH